MLKKIEQKWKKINENMKKTVKELNLYKDANGNYRSK